MCKDCGCSNGGTVEIHTHHTHEGLHHHQTHVHTQTHSTAHAETHAGSGHGHTHVHRHTHGHHNGNGHTHTHTIAVKQAVLDKNDRLAERNRGFFLAKGLLCLNVLSSPGSGKTALLTRTLAALAATVRCGVVVGDLETDNDAQRLRETGVPVAQITTGTVCHLEADMVLRAYQQLAAQDLELLVIENVGNLVCPAAYDLGEDQRIVLLSVTEGEDKPLKYPTMFKSADVVVVNKIDIAAAVGFDRETAIANIQRVAPQATLFELSARTGEGLDEWLTYLRSTLREKQATPSLA